MNLKDEIIKLIELQEIDLLIYKIRHEVNTVKPAILEELKHEFENQKQEFLTYEEAVKKLRLVKKDKELELAAKEESLAKYQGQLYQLKTNKEYQAKLNEIASIKADISKAEEEVLEALDAIDKAKLVFENQKQVLDKTENKFKEEGIKIKNEIEDMEAKVKNLQEKRKSFVEHVDQKIISKYENLLETRNGLAAVAISNGNCLACNLRVTHQTINEIKMYDKLVLCSSCVRILYIPGDLKA